MNKEQLDKLQLARNYYNRSGNYAKFKPLSALAILENIAGVISETYGPSGRYSMRGNGSNGDIEITKDGHHTLEYMQFSYPEANMILNLVKELTQKVSLYPGDGTTTATIFFKNLFSELIDEENNVRMTSQELDEKLSFVVNEIRSELHSVGEEYTLDSLNSVLDGLLISLNSDKRYLKIIMKAMNLLDIDYTYEDYIAGKYCALDDDIRSKLSNIIVDLDKNANASTSISMHSGLKVPILPRYANKADLHKVYENARSVYISTHINTPKSLLFLSRVVIPHIFKQTDTILLYLPLPNISVQDVLKKYKSDLETEFQGKHIFFVYYDMANNYSNLINIAEDIPAYLESTPLPLVDIQKSLDNPDGSTDDTMMSENNKLYRSIINNLKPVTISFNTTHTVTRFEGDRDPSGIFGTHISYMRDILHSIPSDSPKYTALFSRIKSLTGNIAIINIGSSTKAKTGKLFDMFQDTVFSMGAGLKHGYGPGMNLSVPKIINRLTHSEDNPFTDPDVLKLSGLISKAFMKISNMLVDSLTLDSDERLIIKDKIDELVKKDISNELKVGREEWLTSWDVADKTLTTSVVNPVDTDLTILTIVKDYCMMLYSTSVIRFNSVSEATWYAGKE